MQLPFMGTVAVDDFNYGTQAAVAGGTTFLCKTFIGLESLDSNITQTISNFLSLFFILFFF